MFAAAITNDQTDGATHVRRNSLISLAPFAILLASALLMASACGDAAAPAGNGGNRGGGGGGGGGGTSDAGPTISLSDGSSTPDQATASARCGDGKRDPSEDCDGADLGGSTCASLGFDSGKLACRADCTHDTSGCAANSSGRGFGQKCGGSWGACKSGLTCVLFNESGKQEGYCTQQCSDSSPCPSSPAGAQCVFKLSASGQTVCGFLCSPSAPSCPAGLACSYSKQGGYHYCTTDPPAKCGNGKRELAEECDGADLNNMSCKAFGYTAGTLRCSSSCKLDKSGCTGTSACTNLPPRDCTGGGTYCGELVAFSPMQGPGYVVAHGKAFSWIRRDTMMLVKYATAAVACIMPGTYPLATGDMSMQNGGTPASNGRLRHPKGTHDYGRDVDIAYYQTGQPDNMLRPVCKHTSGGADAYHCTAAPNILDVPRTTLFIAKMLESSRVRVIGVDGKIGPLLQAEAQKLLAKGLITAAAANAFQSKLAFETTDTQRGWFRFHHHHLHLSTQTGGYSSMSPPLPDQPAWSPVPGRAGVALPQLMPKKIVPLAAHPVAR